MRKTLIILVIMFSGCSASYHAKKAVKKNPNAFMVDTTVVIDTFYYTVPKIDTTFIFEFDTVEYVQQDVKIKYFYDTLTSEVFIEADCPDQETIVKTKTITLPPIIIQPTFFERIKDSLIMTALSVVLIFVTLYFLRR